MSQQPYQQPGQPGGYQQQPGQPQGYPQGGYQQPAQPQPYGGYQGSGPGYPSPTSSRSNPFSDAGTLANILQIVGYVLPVLGVIAFIMALVIGDVNGTSFYPGTYKFFLALVGLIAGVGFGVISLTASFFIRKSKA